MRKKVLKKPNLNVPNYPKPSFEEAYSGKYYSLNTFKHLRIRFWKSGSKDYRFAKFLVSQFPQHTTASAKNYYWTELFIDDEMNCYINYKLLLLLSNILLTWKFVEYYIDSEICYNREFLAYVYNLGKILDFPDIIQINPMEKEREFNDKWKNEKKLFSIISNNFNTYTVERHYRDSWLDNLELDIYIPELKIGIEYQGIQHYKPLKHWGGEDGFKTRKANDLRKKKLCDKNGVQLIYFTYQETITPEFVLDRLSHDFSIESIQTNNETSVAADEQLKKTGTDNLGK